MAEAPLETRLELGRQESDDEYAFDAAAAGPAQQLDAALGDGRGFAEDSRLGKDAPDDVGYCLVDHG